VPVSSNLENFMFLHFKTRIIFMSFRSEISKVFATKFLAKITFTKERQIILN